MIVINNINQCYQWAVNTCNAPKVGYSQQFRNQKTMTAAALSGMP